MGHNYTRIGGKITPNFLQCGFILEIIILESHYKYQRVTDVIFVIVHIQSSA